MEAGQNTVQCLFGNSFLHSSHFHSSFRLVAEAGPARVLRRRRINAGIVTAGCDFQQA